MATHSLVMKELGRGVRAFPHLRVGQLIENAVQAYLPGQDLFYITDADLCEALRSLVAEHGR